MKFHIVRLAKVLITVLLFMFNLTKYPLLFAQEQSCVTVDLKPKEINGSDFNGELSMVVNNYLKETVFVAIKPYYCYYKSDSVIFYLSANGGNFCPNEVSFFKKGSKIVPFGVESNITFFKFPPILMLAPGSNLFIYFHLEKDRINVLKNIIWSVKYDFRFALKPDVDVELTKLPDNIKREFNASVFCKDTLNIDLLLKADFSSDTSLYISKNGNNFPYDYESTYDSLLKYFWRRPKYND